jgi:hypothetical protein
MGFRKSNEQSYVGPTKTANVESTHIVLLA